MGARRRAPLWLAGALTVLNFLDGLFTLHALGLGLARELNPVMAWAYGRSPMLFATIKLASVQGGVALLLAHRGTSIAHRALWICTAIYSAIVAYQLVFLLAV